MKTEKRTKLYLTGILSLGIILTAYGGAVLAKQEGQPQKFCPVMGSEIDKSAYADYEGKRVYFCCPGCKASFLETPDKYIKDMESKGIVLEKVPHPKAGKKHGHGGDRREDHPGMGHGSDNPHGPGTQ